MTAPSTDDLLGSFPPAPEEWTRRAEELPQLQRALELFGARCPDGDPAAHPREADAALREAGLEPDDRRARLLGRLREALGED